jgi:hypothetical protein
MALTWNGKQVTAQISQALVEALTEIDLRIETAAKSELYPGHGKRTGNLQRAIQSAPARIEGTKIRGSVGVKGVKYALRIHHKFKYIHKGVETVRPQALSIVKKHVARAKS